MGPRRIRVADLLDETTFREQIRIAVREKNAAAAALKSSESLDENAIEDEYAGYAEMLRPLAVDTAEMLARELGAGRSLLMEGAQATMLDIDHGTYPYVTSSSTVSGGAAIGLGVPPMTIQTVVGVSKAYTTRVGGGPFV